MIIAVLILVPANAIAAVNVQDISKFTSRNNTIDHSIVVKEDSISDLDISTDEGG
jgi:hypothetical protein